MVQSSDFRRLPRDYLIENEVVVKTRVLGHLCASEYVDLRTNGLLVIKPGFAWDGASGPAIDTRSIMTAALVHDALYWLIEQGHLPRVPARRQADSELWSHMIHYAQDQRELAQARACLLPFWRRQWAGLKSASLYAVRVLRSEYVYLAVRLFGGLWLKPKQGKPTKMIKKIATTTMFLLLLAGCTKADFFKVVNTADDAAKAACSLFFAEHQGITPEQAAKEFCATREAIDVFLASQQTAGEEYAASQGYARK